MELQETTVFMNSESYKDRFFGEYQQLKIRFEKLHRFNIGIQAAEISRGYGDSRNLEMPKHDCPSILLRDQERIMKEYLDILEIRAKFEEIEL